MRVEKPGEVADDGSVTVKHVFGETKIPAPPKRVVSAGLTGQDDLLAVGVVPIAVTDWFGGEPFGVWPWAQPKLGGAQPVVLNLADGVPVDQIASLKPDLIVATNAGLDQDTYNRLTAIAPTIAQSGQDAFFEPWKAQATTIGQAVFKHDEMQALIAAVEEKFAAAGNNNPQFAGKKVLLLEGRLEQGRGAGGHARLAHRVPHPDGVRHRRQRRRLDSPRPDGRCARLRGRADLDDRERRRAGRSARRPGLGNWAPERNVFTGKELAGAIAFASPLSYPVVADQLPALIASALA